MTYSCVNVVGTGRLVADPCTGPINNEVRTTYTLDEVDYCKGVASKVLPDTSPPP